jgi:hypothetical protein
MEEIARCATNPHVKGIKLHFGNSDVDVRKAIAANVAPYLR